MTHFIEFHGGRLKVLESLVVGLATLFFWTRYENLYHVTSLLMYAINQKVWVK